MNTLKYNLCAFASIFLISLNAFSNSQLPTKDDNFSYWNKSDSTVFEIKHKHVVETGKKNPQTGLKLIDELKCDSIQLTPKQEGRLYYTEGKLKGYVLQYKESIRLFEKTIDNYKKSDEDLTKNIARVYWTMSNSYYRLGEFDKGIEKLFHGFDLIENTKYNFEKSQLSIMMGVLYNGLKEFESAEKHYLKALEYGKLSESKNIYIIQNNLAEIYLAKKEYEKGYEYYTQAARNAKELENYTALLHIYFNIADLKNEIGDYQKAFEFIKKGKVIKEKANSSDLESHLILIEAKLLLNANIEEIDVQELKNILETAERTETLDDAVIAAEILKKYYHKTNKYKEALFYSEKHKLLEDELNSVDTSMKSATIIADNRHKKQLAFIISKKDRAIFTTLISIFILFLLSSTYYVQYKKQINHTKWISTLLDNEKRINQSILEKLKTAYHLKLQKFKYSFSDQVHQNISTHLHDEIASSIAGIKYGLSGLQLEEADPMIDYSIKHLNKVYSSVRNLSHSVSPLSDDSIDFLQTMKEYFDMSSEIPISVNFTGQANESVISTHIKSELFRILKELVLNSNKHSGASHIKIVVKLNEDHIYASVEDNGKGIMTNSGGKGLANIRNRVKQLNGQFQLKSIKGTYTKVFIPLIECKGSLVEDRQI